MKPANSPGEKFQAKNHPNIRPVPFKRELISLDSQSLSRQIIKRQNSTKWTFIVKGKDEKQSDQVQKKIRTIVKSAKGMKKLALDFREWSYPNGFLRYPHILKRLKSLKQIALYHKISNGKIGVYSLMRSLRRLSFLKNIYFNFSSERLRIKDEDICFLSQRLKAFCFLKSFSLDLNKFYKISAEGWSELNSSFSCLVRLERLSLRLNSYEWINETCLETLDFRRLISLREIDLSFNYCQSLTDKGIFPLSRNLKGLDFLQNLRLNLSGCHQIDDHGFVSLWETLTNLSSLEQLEIDFTGWSKVTEAGFMEARKSFKNLALLKKVHLSFTRCTQINGNFLSDLGSGLASLKSLKNLKLGFGQCNQISASDVEEFIKDLNYFQGFEVFALDFENYDQEAIRSCVQSRGENKVDWNDLFSLFGNPNLKANLPKKSW